MNQEMNGNGERLREALRCIDTDNASIPLPCRESELEAIKRFTADGKSGVLVICGNPGTGKTACVRRVVSFSRASSITINCKSTNSVFKQIKDQSAIDIVVLDEFESIPKKEASKIFAYCKENSIKVIAISNSHDEDGTTVMRFDSYTLDQLIQIMKERVNGLVSDQCLKYIAAQVIKERGDARSALKTLTDVILQSISNGLEEIHLSDVIKLLNGNKDEQIVGLPLSQQIALVAIARNKKNWKEEFNSLCRLLKQRVDPDYKYILGCLDDMGMVSQKGPQVKVPFSVIKASVANLLSQYVPE